MKQRLKIGILIDQLIPGGVQKAAIFEVKYLRKFGHDVKLLVLMRSGYKMEFASLAKDIPLEFLSDRLPQFLRINLKFPFFTFLSSQYFTSALMAPKIINRQEFDLIISHGTTTALTSFSVKKFAKIPYFAVIHDPISYAFDKIYSKTNLKYISKILKTAADFFRIGNYSFCNKMYRRF